MGIRALLEKNSSTEEYLDRIDERMRKASTIGKRLAPVAQIVGNSEKHFVRVGLSAKRLHRATTLLDRMSQTFERSLIYVLLYEAVDHVCMVFNLLDFESMDLESALDGHGLAGESAAEVVQLFHMLNEKAGRILELEGQHHLHLDFSEPVDEKEGITWTTIPHWQDFVPGSVQHSFRDYFRGVREAVHRRLEQRPRFWKSQNIRQYLHRKGHAELLRVIGKLEGARL